jgi:hypothetical protein
MGSIGASTAKFAALPGLSEPIEQRTGPNDLVYPVTCPHSRPVRQLTFEVCTDIGPCVQVVTVQHGSRTCLIVTTALTEAAAMLSRDLSLTTITRCASYLGSYHLTHTLYSVYIELGT